MESSLKVTLSESAVRCTLERRDQFAIGEVGRQLATFEIDVCQVVNSAHYNGYPQQSDAFPYKVGSSGKGNQ